MVVCGKIKLKIFIIMKNYVNLKMGNQPGYKKMIKKNKRNKNK